MLVPAIASTGMRCSSSTLSTPMCAAPRAPPPDNTRPMRGRCAASAIGCCCADTVAAASMARAANNTVFLDLLFIRRRGKDSRSQ
jgi:hypothetical protein